MPLKGEEENSSSCQMSVWQDYVYYAAKEFREQIGIVRTAIRVYALAAELQILLKRGKLIAQTVEEH